MHKLSWQKPSGGACKEAVETSLRPFTFVTRDTTSETLFVCACPSCPDCARTVDTFKSKAKSMQPTTNVFMGPLLYFTEVNVWGREDRTVTSHVSGRTCRMSAEDNLQSPMRQHFVHILSYS